MRLIYPVQSDLGDATTSSSETVGRLAEVYAHPDGGSVRANMVTSVDGAVSVDGRSGGLSGAADRLIFKVLRGLADVVLVGAGTARAEHYGLAKPDWPQLREGRPATAPIAIVTRQLTLDLDSPLLQGSPDRPRTIILTTDLAPEPQVIEASKTADVITFQGGHVSGSDAVGKLAELGYRDILVEGGPMLLGQLVAEDVLDELCATTAPLLAGGQATRMITGGSIRPMRLASVIEDEGFLLSMYARAERQAG